MDIESFYRARFWETITSDTNAPFDLKVSKLPELSSWYLTGSPETSEEELFHYDSITWTPWEPWTIHIDVRWYNYSTNTSDTWNQKDHTNNLSEIRWDINHIHLNDKADKITDNEIESKFDFISTTIAQLKPQRVTTAQRDALTGVEDWVIIINTDLWVKQTRLWWAWITDWDTGTPNASESNSWKVQQATLVEQWVQDETWSSWAPLFISPKNTTKIFNGSWDENKVPLLDWTWRLDSWLIPTRPIVAKTSDYPVVSWDNWKAFTNEWASGTIDFTLPTAVTGLTNIFINQNTNWINIKPNTWDSIRSKKWWSTVTNITSDRIFLGNIWDTVKVTAINDTEWIAEIITWEILSDWLLLQNLFNNSILDTSWNWLTMTVSWTTQYWLWVEWEADGSFDFDWSSTVYWPNSIINRAWVNWKQLPFSIALYVNIDTFTANKLICTTNNWSASESWIQLQINWAGNWFAFWMYNWSGAIWWPIDTGNIGAGASTWHHIIIELDWTTNTWWMKITVDWIEYTGTMTTTTFSHTDPLTFWGYSTTTGDLDWRIARLNVYDRILTSNEKAELLAEKTI